MRPLALTPLFLLAACSGGGATPDGGNLPGPADLAVPADPADAAVAPADAAGPVPDIAMPPDMGDILGTHSGACGTLMARLHDPNPALVEDSLVFMQPEMWGRAALSPDGKRFFDTPNAGGSSLESEVMSFEVLRYCEGASLYKTETEIAYAPPDDAGANTITDYEITMYGEKVGVSVTRAYKPSGQGVYTDIEVKSLLEKKLHGVVRSSMRVMPADRWVKQILHVWVANQDARAAVARVWPQLDAATRADTIVLLTATTGGGFIYCNPDPPLGSECPP